jgi:ketosteroid isomerase-like protein
MKNRSFFTLTGLVVSFAVPALAQHTDTPDPLKRSALVAFEKNVMEAWNNNDAHALSATFTEDAVLVTDRGPIYGRETIERFYADLFQTMHFNDYHIMPDQYSPHAIGTAGNEDWATGEWSLIVKGQTFGPIQVKGFWSAIHAREGDVWKNRMVTENTIPAKAVTPSSMASPSSK